MSKLVIVDKVNSIVVLFGILSLRWCKRGGSAWVICRGCGFELSTIPVVHMIGYYIQLGRWGGNIWWKSKKCYEVNNDD